MGIEKHGERTWVSTTGGPLILVEERVLEEWNGTDVDDYDRACSCSELVEAVKVGDTLALVLGDEPAMTCAKTLPDGIILVRWHAADDIAKVDRAIDALSCDGARGEPVGIELDIEGPLVLFDAVEPGAEQKCFTVPEGAEMADGAVRVHLARGRYRVELGSLDPAVGSLSLVLLKRLSS